MPNEKGLLRLQRRLARAERTGDNLAMARGYLILADELLKIGNHRLGILFVERAGECLSWIDTAASHPDGPSRK